MPSLWCEHERIKRALHLMLQVHFQQKDRPDGQPYINHPLDVALSVLNEYQIYDPNILIAALLHDSVEDQTEAVIAWADHNVAYKEAPRVEYALRVIEGLFGRDVAELVGTLTNPDFDAEAERLTADKEEKDNIKIQLYLQHIESIYDDNVSAFVIKLADFSHNALHLDVLEEGPRKNWLRSKYWPVILMISHRLQELADKSHPLYRRKDEISETLLQVYARDYQTT
jgi:(p)ppGpp synthase/HD superfamily hydrolase